MDKTFSKRENKEEVVLAHPAIGALLNGDHKDNNNFSLLMRLVNENRIFTNVPTEKKVHNNNNNNSGRDGLSKPEQDEADHHRELLFALADYNPTMNLKYNDIVKERMNISHTLSAVKALAETVQEEVEGTTKWKKEQSVFPVLENKNNNDVEKGACLDVWRRLLRLAQQRNENRFHTIQTNNKNVNWQKYVEEMSGICANLYHPNQKAFFAEKSDFQLHEILSAEPTNKNKPAKKLIVSLTDTKLENTNYLHSPKCEEDFQHAFADNTVYMHFVLFHCGKSLMEVSFFLLDALRRATDGAGVFRPPQLADLRFNQYYDDGCTATQLGSIRLSFSPDHNEQERFTASVNVLQSLLWDLEKTAYQHKTNHQDYTPMAVELLRWRSFPCAVRHPSQVQYALLLRGLYLRKPSIDTFTHKIIHQISQKFPNYYAAPHFGPVGCVLCRSYHVSSALAFQRVGEALVMTVLLCSWKLFSQGGNSEAPVPEWILRIVRALFLQQERRPAQLRALWLEVVPPPIRAHFETASAHLLFNVLASHRVKEMQAEDPLSAPQPGDFVHDGVASPASGGSTRSEWSAEFPWRETGDNDVVRTACEGIRPIFTSDEATGLGQEHIALPVVDHRDTCVAVQELSAQLGLAPRSTTPPYANAAPPPFRPLLAGLTGFPHADKPWVKLFREVSFDKASDRYRLFTDYELAERKGRDYAQRSRGQQRQLWPLSKRGRAVTERLPVGLSAAAAMHRPEDGYHSLVMHVTVSDDTYISNFLREIAKISQQW
ncbi:hypothetical protein ADEAN_000514800 [Angomonas deanei]|uniref:Uncharacterized protein n=1 Tax=Angomonas deanei TaxID=59799 RepID=A0A7G2CCW2_9TRYP|nr:hypothetical protein ADEAN_000514800 [Angomonas deanei]